MKPVKAWAVTVLGDLCPWGNGHEFQHPVMYRRSDAEAFVSRVRADKRGIVRVEIRELPRKEAKR